MTRVRLNGGRLAGLLAMALSVGVALDARAIPLIEAVKTADAEAVRARLDAGDAAGASEADGTTALHWAVHQDESTIVDLLLDAGAPVAAANRYGVQPLYLAATNGNGRIVRRLLEAGADANAALPEGETALMTAARTGDVETIRALLEYGADVNAREGWRSQTALMWAAAENNAGAIAVLLEAGAELEAVTPAGSFTPLLFAVRAGQVAAARALLDAGADPNQTLPDGTSALVLAATNARYEMAATLLEYGADPNAADQGWTALHQIAWSRRWNMGFNLPGPVQAGNVDGLELVRRLVAHGADINARQTQEPKDGNRNKLNRIGATAFVLAAKAADVPLMRVLLEEGADPSIPTELGTTALMTAAGVGIWAPGENPGTHEEALAAVRLAYEVGGGSVNDVDQNGETALHGAVYRGGAIPIIQFLADRGATLDAVNSQGWTPVIAADGLEYTPNVLKRYPEAARLLRRLMAEQGLDVPPSSQPGREGAPAAIEAPVAAVDAVESPVALGPERTIWDGVFTDPQAERGRQVYQQSCALCHLDDLLGDGGAPALVGSVFTSRWAGVTVHDMVETIRSSMPQEAPDSLGDQAYVDLVTYMLSVHGNPTGAEELSVESEALSRIMVTAR